MAEFPYMDWTLVPHDKFWWYVPDDCRAEETLEDHWKCYQDAGGWEEPETVLKHRIREFESWICERRETKFAVVSHGNFSPSRSTHLG